MKNPMTPEETNPWRPVVNGEWPECKPKNRIEVKFKNGTLFTEIADEISWFDSNVIKWRYAEDG